MSKEKTKRNSEMYRLHTKEGKSTYWLSRKYGIAQTTVLQILTRIKNRVKIKNY